MASSDVEGHMFRREFTPSALRRSLGFTLGSVWPDVVLGPLTAAAAHHDGALNLSEKGPALRNSQTRKADTWVPSSLNADFWVSRTIDAAVPHCQVHEAGCSNRRAPHRTLAVLPMAL